MSRVSPDRAIQGSAAAMSAAYAVTDMATLLSVTFTTDAPAAADRSITIPDGDAAGVTGAEMAALAQEAEGVFATIKFEFNNLLAAMRTRGVDVASVPAMATLLTVAYTTDNPGITPGGTTTVADGDATLVRAEFNDVCEEFEAALGSVKTQHNAIRTALLNYAANGPTNLTALGTLWALTFTTDAPSAANGSVTIADGDAATATVATGVELYQEIETQLASVATSYDALLTAMIAHGLAS